MGNDQSILQRHGYTLLEEAGELDFGSGVRRKCTKEGKEFIGEAIDLTNMDYIAIREVQMRTTTLKSMNHPNIVNYKETFEGLDKLYIVMDCCEGGILSQIIEKQGKTVFPEDKILDWFVQICMALKYIHNQNILHKDIKPQNIFLSKAGQIRLGGFKIVMALRGLEWEQQIDGVLSPHYESLEIFEGKCHDEKSEIWSLGCVLYELCMLECAYTAVTENDIVTKLNRAPTPRLSDIFSSDLRDLVNELLQKNPARRPSVTDILGKPFILQFLLQKFTMTVDELQVKVDELKEIIAHMERVHYGSTAGSLAGGVIGAAGGITSIVGLILAPFTLGASLIVTGVGIGVAVAGGVTGAASNITNMVKQSADRNSIQAILNECQEKMDLSVTCLQNISDGINTVNAARSIDSVGLAPSRTNQALVRAGRGLAGVGELVRLIQVANIGKVAAQVARTVRVAEAATGVLAGLFVALDIYFIAKDSREIHAMRQESTNRTDNSDDNKSDTKKFIDKMKQAVTDLQNCVDELRGSVPELLQIQDR
ncbi:hypothetical protein AGOR_G00029840 [Albula goreensis]|uniref:non-specific serine/threonine protein kinase n=1 Tax=Albula goreensis TaxID=1534307 RepID=A0A8T3E369_9TELE|nr:hypothetical protein AGOR_G00029840 [Albula goreensis]